MIELRHAIQFVHHTIGSRDIDGTVTDTIKGILGKGMVLGVERDNRRTCQRTGDRIVVLRHVLLHELLNDGSAVTGLQTIELSIADGGIHRCPDGIEPRAVERLGELGLLSECRKLGQLRVVGDILPQRLAGTGQVACRRH